MELSWEQMADRLSAGLAVWVEREGQEGVDAAVSRVVRDTVAEGYEFPVEVVGADLDADRMPLLTVELSGELPEETMEFFDGALREELFRAAGVPYPEDIDEAVELMGVGFTV